MTGGHVILALTDLIQSQGSPTYIRSDNGSEFVAHQVKEWIEEHGIGAHYISPANPWENPFVESFNSIIQATFLNRWCFLTLAEAKAQTIQWHEECNLTHSHGSLAGLSPFQFLRNFRGDNPKLKPMTIPKNLTLKLDL